MLSKWLTVGPQTPCANRVTLATGQPRQKDQQCDQRFDALSCVISAWPLEKEGSRKLSSIMWLMIQSIMPTWRNPDKNSRHRISDKLGGRCSVHFLHWCTYWEGDTFWFHKERTCKLFLWDPPRSHPMGFFFWLVLLCILFAIIKP